MTRMIKCPNCRTETTWTDNPYRPFCSERCRMIDLGNWAEGEYRVAGAPVVSEEESTEKEEF